MKVQILRQNRNIIINNKQNKLKTLHNAINYFTMV